MAHACMHEEVCSVVECSVGRDTGERGERGERAERGGVVCMNELMHERMYE